VRRLLHEVRLARRPNGLSEIPGFAHRQYQWHFMRLGLCISTALLIGFVLGTILLTHNALHAPPRFTASSTAADELARNTDSGREDARVIAGDGVARDGWRFTPREPNGSVVILLHGIADNRQLSPRLVLIAERLVVRLPDLRGQGASGGELIT
jgi:hypothetical protein